MPEQESVLELIDLIRIVIRRWKWIVLGTAVCTLLAAGIAFTSPAIFQVDGFVLIGSTRLGPKQIFLEDPYTAAEKLKLMALKLMRNDEFKGKLGSLFSPDDINLTVFSGGIVKLSVRTRKNPVVLDFLKAVAQELVDDHETLYVKDLEELNSKKNSTNTTIELLRRQENSTVRRLELIEKEMKFVKTEIVRSNEQLAELVRARVELYANAKGDQMALMLFGAEIRNLQSYISGLEEREDLSLPRQMEDTWAELDKIRSEISIEQTKADEASYAPSDLRRTAVITEPQFVGPAVWPPKRLTIVLAACAGMMVSLFVVFVWEYIARNRRKIFYDE